VTDRIAINSIKPKMKLEGKVIKVELAGARIDIGAERDAFLHISELQPGRAATRVADVVAADPSKRPHVERHGLAYRELNNSGQVLPREVSFVHFEADPVTPMPADALPDEKIDFRFPRYAEVMQDWKSNISDHCPVKVWF